MARIGEEYLQVTMATVVVLVVLMIGGGALRGLGDSQTPMRVTALANVVNVFLTYGLIFGVAGLPALGRCGKRMGHLSLTLVGRHTPFVRNVARPSGCLYFREKQLAAGTGCGFVSLAYWRTGSSGAVAYFCWFYDYDGYRRQLGNSRPCIPPHCL